MIRDAAYYEANADDIDADIPETPAYKWTCKGEPTQYFDDRETAVCDLKAFDQHQRFEKGESRLICQITKQSWDVREWLDSL